MLAWRHVSALRDPEAWDAWLHRLTVRACYRLARTHRRRDVVELHVVPDLEPAWTHRHCRRSSPNATGSAGSSAACLSTSES